MPDQNSAGDPAVKPDQKATATSALQQETVPEELTGQAAATNDDLTSLFRNDSPRHFADGFSGGSDDDTGVATVKDDAARPEKGPLKPKPE